MTIMKNNWPLAAALLVSVFSAGALSALAVDRLLDRDRPDQVDARRGEPGDFRQRGGPGRGGRGGPGGPGQLGLSPVILDRLQLSEEQRTEVMETLERRRERSDALLDQLRPQLRAQLDSALDEVRALLTPAQRSIFDRLLLEERNRFLRRH